MFPSLSVLHGDVGSPDDTGRDNWSWVWQLSGREHDSTPRSGMEAPRMVETEPLQIGLLWLLSFLCVLLSFYVCCCYCCVVCCCVVVVCCLLLCVRVVVIVVLLLLCCVLCVACCVLWWWLLCVLLMCVLDVCSVLCVVVVVVVVVLLLGCCALCVVLNLLEQTFVCWCLVQAMTVIVGVSPGFVSLRSLPNIFLSRNHGSPFFWSQRHV